jgi:hypothetical protein
MPMRIAMIEITTSSSTRVNALFFMGRVFRNEVHLGRDRTSAE